MNSEHVEIKNDVRVTKAGVPWQNIQPENILITFCHPWNVHPTQCPRVHCIHCDISTPDRTSRDFTSTQPQGGCNVAETKCQSYFTWIVTKRQLWDIFPFCFMPSLFPYCDILFLCDILPLFDTRPLSHTMKFITTVSFSLSSDTYFPLPSFIVYLHSMYSMCVHNVYVTEFTTRGWRVRVSQAEQKFTNRCVLNYHVT